MNAPWPCSACGAPGARNVGARGYCGRHLAALYQTFDAAVWQMQGIGLQAGPRRPDYGPEFVELECAVCGAAWVGALLDPCPWCAAAVEWIQRWQADKVLTPPEVDVDDRDYAARMEAWAGRLARAVEAELVNESEALTVWRKVVSDVHRAA